MSDYSYLLLTFFISLIAILGANLLLRVRDAGKIKNILKNENILAGVLQALFVVGLLSLGVVLSAYRTHAGEWSYLNYMEVEAGITYTKKISPACEDASEFNKGTSDLRAALNYFSYTSGDGRLRIDGNGEILHHSCAFGEDSKSFDSFAPIKTRIRWTF